MLRAIKIRLRGILAPTVFLALTYYFMWNAIHGKNGLEVQAQQRQQLQMTREQENATDQQLRTWQTKVAALSGQSIEPDMLDEEARAVLNLANPHDLVIELPSPKSPK